MSEFPETPANPAHDGDLAPPERAASALRNVDWLALLLIPLAALLACVPFLSRGGISCGHDFDFHLISWMETKLSWKNHIFYPHWAQTPNWDAGEPRFVFYPPLSWMVGAALGCLMHWDNVPGAFIFLVLVATGFSTRALARLFLSRGRATLAAILAVVTPYGLFTAYERSAFAELAAAAWIPLLLLFTWRPPQTAATGRWPVVHRVSSVVPLAGVLALTWLTNAPAGVMASYLLAYAALAAAILLRAWWPVVRALIAAPLGLGLAAFYLVPAAWEQRWIAIHQALDVGMRIVDSWLFSHHPGSDMELHDRVLLFASLICVLTTAMAAAAAIYCFLRKKIPADRRSLWPALILLVPGIFLLQLPVSAPIWHVLPKLQFLQFPWRWLTVLATPYAIVLAAATPLATRRARIFSILTWTIVLLIFAATATLFFYQICDEEDEVRHQYAIFWNGTGMDGTDEYAPTGADNSLIASGLPEGCLVSDPDQQLGEGEQDAAPVWYQEQGSCDDTYTAQLWQPQHKILSFDSDHEGFVVLRLRRYPAWQVTVNGVSLDQLVSRLPQPLPLRDDGLMVVPVPAGPSTIEVRWLITPDQRWGRDLSLISLALLMLMWLVSRLARRDAVRNAASTTTPPALTDPGARL